MHVKFEPIQNSYIFSQKNADSAGPRNIVKFQHFLKFTKFHQTCRIYWNHHQKHACEIWAHSEKLTYFIEKCIQCRPLKYHENFNIFPKFTKFFIKLAEHIGIIIRNMHVKFEPFRRSYIFNRKMLTVHGLEMSWNFNIFSKFTKFHQTCRTYWNHHQKHACEIWAFSEKLKFFTEKYRQCWP